MSIKLRKVAVLRGILFALAVLAVSVLYHPMRAHATGLDPDRTPWGAWKLSIAPYGWYIWLNVEQTVQGQTVAIETNLYEILNEQDNIQAWFSYQEARNGPLTLYSDVQYINVEFAGDMVIAKRLSPGLSIDANVNIGAAVELAVVEAGAMLEVFRINHGHTRAHLSTDDESFARHTALDVVGGTRVWWLEADIDMRADITVNLNALGLRRSQERNLAVAESGSVSWVDPMVGARLRHHMAPGQQIVLRGDVGGFDVGSSFTWQALGYYEWECQCKPFGTTLHARLGYRALDVDYSDMNGRSDFAYQSLQHGPIAYMRMEF
jgi:hypothetical protein